MKEWAQSSGLKGRGSSVFGKVLLTLSVTLQPRTNYRYSKRDNKDGEEREKQEREQDLVGFYRQPAPSVSPSPFTSYIT